MTQPIEEFLVGLGFKIDANSFKLFSGGILAANTAVGKLGLSAVNAGRAVELMVEKVARQFENLYYISELSGASVGNLQAWQYGAQQIGLSADEATGMVKNLGLAMKANPGIEALMRGLGVNTRDSHGQLRDTKLLLDDLNAQLIKLPTYMQAAYAPLFGETLPELILWADHAKDAADATEDFARRQRAAGIDAKQFSEDSRNFDNDLRKFGSVFEIIGTQVAKFFMPSMDHAIKGVGEFFMQLSGQDAATSKTVQNLKLLGGYFEGAAKSAVDWANKLYITQVLLAALKAAPETATTGLVVGADAAGVVSSYVSEPTANEKQAAGTLGRALMRMGWSKANAAAIVANLMTESGGNAGAEGDLDIHGNAQAYGLGQWHPKRQADFAKLFKHDIRNSTVEEQLKFLTWELTKGPYKSVGDKLKTTDDPAIGGALVSHSYESPRDDMGEQARRARAAAAFAASGFDTPLGSVAPAAGKGGTVINQKTDIHVAGGPSAQETAHKVADLQSSVNSRMLRNRTPAAQ